MEIQILFQYLLEELVFPEIQAPVKIITSLID